ncbi:hypothetical protein LJC58_10320 [Lachnospiraceae bacterium OttesenSCG-928-D06]|nr:hypothetical protein [Lachnospiraceae bacterium OttesenSCG-928-D06]
MNIGMNRSNVKEFICIYKTVSKLTNSSLFFALFIYNVKYIFIHFFSSYLTEEYDLVGNRTLVEKKKEEVSVKL